MRSVIIIVMFSSFLLGCRAEKHYIKTGELPGGWSTGKSDATYSKQNKDRYGFVVGILLLGVISSRRTVNALA